MRVYLLTAFYAGFVALYAQTLMLRTALTLFDGNELVAGIFLALWMLLTALGARVKLYPTRFRLIMVSLVLACWLPLAEKLAPMAFTRYFPSGKHASSVSILYVYAGLDSTCVPVFGHTFQHANKTKTGSKNLRLRDAWRFNRWHCSDFIASRTTRLCIPLLDTCNDMATHSFVSSKSKFVENSPWDRLDYYHPFGPTTKSTNTRQPMGNPTWKALKGSL